MNKPAGQKFFNACSTGKVELVREFLAQGVDPESRDSYQLTGMIWAGRKGRVEVAEVLLSHGAKLETGDVRRRTALFHAVAYNRFEFVKFIVMRGADPNPVDTHGCSPLDISESKMRDLLSSLGAISARKASNNGPQ